MIVLNEVVETLLFRDRCPGATVLFFFSGGVQYGKLRTRSRFACRSFAYGQKKEVARFVVEILWLNKTLGGSLKTT